VEDFAETVGESAETTARSFVRQGGTKHLEHMLSSAQRIEHPIEACSKWGGWHFRLRNHETDWAAAAADANPVVMRIVRLLAAAPMADDQIASTNRASSRESHP
jgi:hypothetical protein